MGYKVVVRFMDLDDNNFIYEEGWDYPRANHFVSEQRLKELSSTDNRQGMPLIVESGEVNLTVDEIIMPIEEPVEVPQEEVAEPVVEEKPKKTRKKK